MNIIVSLVVGTFVGWLASMLMRTENREGLIRNVAAGVAGAYVGGWLLSAMSDSGNPGDFSFGVVIASSLGAATLLLLVKRYVHL